MPDSQAVTWKESFKNKYYSQFSISVTSERNANTLSAFLIILASEDQRN